MSKVEWIVYCRSEPNAEEGERIAEVMNHVASHHLFVTLRNPAGHRGFPVAGDARAPLRLLRGDRVIPVGEPPPQRNHHRH